MKDLDFDELDKAVNSLMGTPEAARETPATAEAEKVEVATPTAADTPVATTPVASAPAPAARRSGRFMDVMHPGNSPKPVATNTSRVGVTIAPRPEVASPATEPATPAISVEPVTSTPVEAPSPSPSEQTWPDPLDMMATPKPKVEEAPASATEPEIPTPKEAVPSETELEINKLLDEPAPTSPFLPDAKVEKRPLGNEPSAEAESPVEEVKPEEKKDAPAESEKAVDVVPDEGPKPEEAKPETPAPQPMPAELSENLVNIESGKSKKDEAPKIEETESPREKQDADNAAASATGATSINQQYKEQPSTGDQDHTAIYDVENHPEPLAHPAKKKSGWMWIIWILLLLAIGSGGAVVLYNMGFI